MSADERFDAIIVGAGPAGCSCAYALARAGKSVLLVERGVTAGSKNLSGGRLYTYALEMLEPGLYKKAPLQRKVVREQVMVLAERRSTTIDYADYDFEDEAPQSYTVLRAPLDEWFASEAEAQGAFLASGILVEDLVEENGKIVGIRAGEDEMRADVVVAADGVNSLLSQRAGLSRDIQANTVGIGIKEVIELPEKEIDSRFNLSPGEGVARVAIGCTEAIAGGAFLYTNKSSVSLGIVFNPVQAAKHGKRIQEILQDFKTHPAMQRLLEGGTTIEYGAHLVPELGLSGVHQKLYREGLVVIGDAAGFGINTGTIIRGMDLAIVSGLAAANAITQAAEPAQVGQLYMRQLTELMLLPNMKAFEGWHHILEIPRLFKEYPQLLNDAMRFMFSVDGKVPEKITKAMSGILKSQMSLRQMAADGWKAYRSI